MQSGRFEVTSMSIVTGLGITDSSESPGFPEWRMRMPEWSSPSSSSSAEHNMPLAL